MDLILEIIYRKLSVYASDFDIFARYARRCQLQGEDVDMFLGRHPSLQSQLDTYTEAITQRRSSFSEPPFEDACSSFDEPAVENTRKEELPMEDAIDTTIENNDDKKTD